MNYQISTENFINPERGLHLYTKTVSSSAPGVYQSLTPSTLTDARSKGISIILRIFDLGNFKTTAISSAYLTKMQDDFNLLRTHGVKCIVLFRYTSTDSNDASKAQILSHINQLKPICLQNEDVIYSFHAGFIGKYGEWYYSNNFGTTNLTAQQLLDRKEVGLKIMELSPNRVVQFRTVAIMKQVGGNLPITSANAYDGSILSRIGLHNDALLADSSDMGTFTNTTSDYTYLENQSKYTFCGGESNKLNTNYQNCTNSLLRLNQFNYSDLNQGYHPDVIAYWKTNNCYDEIVRKLGYRFELVDSNILNGVLTINVRNVGFANLYNRRKVYLVARNITTNAENRYEIQTTDIRRWGSEITPINFDLAVLPQGTHQLFLDIPDLNINNKLNSIRLANLNTWEASTGYNNLLQSFTAGQYNTTPPPTVNTTNYNYKQGEVATSLVATGQNLKWYLNGVSSTVAPTPNTNIVGTVVYSVTQTISNVESSGVNITVIVSPVTAILNSGGDVVMSNIANGNFTVKYIKNGVETSFNLNKL